MMPTGAAVRAMQSSRRLVMSWDALTEYLVDAIQRNVLMLDVLRRRGNTYLEYISSDVPHVLGFAFEPVLDGRTLPRQLRLGTDSPTAGCPYRRDSAPLHRRRSAC